MAIVVKWLHGGEYLVSVRSATVQWSRMQRKAKRFASRSAFENYARTCGVRKGPFEAKWWSTLRYVRLVPGKRHASPQP
jgi:hypothetical protein